jgi:hypothetical protein
MHPEQVLRPVAVAVSTWMRWQSRFFAGCPTRFNVRLCLREAISREKALSAKGEGERRVKQQTEAIHKMRKS